MTEKFSRKEKPLKNGRVLLLREAEPEDAENILAFLNCVGGESDYLLFGRDEFTMSPEQERRLIAGLQRQENSLMLLGFIGEELVSVSSLSCFDGRVRTAHRGEIAVSVRKEYWGMGAGRAALEALIGFARRHRLEILQLDVRADNERAVSLYRSLGFETLGRYRRFFKLGGEYFDALCMNLYLEKC